MTRGMTIYFVRHGETYFNYYGRMQGWSNMPLTPTGIKNVEKSARGLADIKFDAVYTSDLQRTIDTAEIILKENRRSQIDEIISMPEFREVFFGSFEGMAGNEVYDTIAKTAGFEQVAQLFQQTDMNERMNYFKAADPYQDAESFHEFWTRISQGLVKVVNKHRDSGDVLLMVLHGAVIRNLAENLSPDYPHIAPLENASVSKVVYADGLFKVESYNDISHFK